MHFYMNEKILHWWHQFRLAARRMVSCRFLGCAEARSPLPAAAAAQLDAEDLRVNRADARRHLQTRFAADFNHGATSSAQQ